MRGTNGFLYEEHINNILRQANLSPNEFCSGGAAPNAPDALFIHKGNVHKLELKFGLTADYGQSSLNYDLENNKWILNGANTPSAQEMVSMLKELGVAELANEIWGPYGVPMKAIVLPVNYTKEHVEHDYKYFKNTFLDVPTDVLYKYYAMKDTHYIQVSKYGFYYLDEDVAGLGVPKFDVGLRCRLRIKRGGTLPIHNYRFTTSLKIVRKPVKSDFNLENNVEFLL